MTVAERFQNFIHEFEARKKLGIFKTSLKNLSWFAVGTVFIFFLGVIFFIVGVVDLSTHRTDSSSDGSETTSSTSGWIFFAIGMVLIILGLSAFLGKCFCPRPTNPARQARSQHRQRGRRVSVANDRPAPRNQRIWSIPSPLNASTPVCSEPSATPTAAAPISERRPSNAPPSYDEAIGRARQNATGNVTDHDPPPYNPSDLDSRHLNLHP
uniref:Uncharacterized protein n=1 Tax=Panagrolaimus sp. JU765 TaxID=591449 RepID=A0AC34QRX5_9BILA